MVNIQRVGLGVYLPIGRYDLSEYWKNEWGQGFGEALNHCRHNCDLFVDAAGGLRRPGKFTQGFFFYTEY